MADRRFPSQRTLAVEAALTTLAALAALLTALLTALAGLVLAALLLTGLVCPPCC